MEACECVKHEPSLKLGGEAGRIDPQRFGIIRNAGESETLDDPTQRFVSRRQVRCRICENGGVQPG